MKRKDWEVKDYGRRPAGPSDECFYCHEPRGRQHKPACVIRKKTVIIKIEIEMLRSVPEDWDKKAIEFKLNESSWCADTIIADLTKQSDRTECLCHHFKGQYIREATEEDEKTFNFTVQELPS